MNPEQTIAALSKELHIGFFNTHGAQLLTTVSKEQLETLASRIAEKAIAEHLAKQSTKKDAPFWATDRGMCIRESHCLCAINPSQDHEVCLCWKKRPGVPAIAALGVAK